MSLNSSSLPNLTRTKTAPQIGSIPDELLLSIFEKLDAFQRCLLLPTCKRWNEALLSNHSFWDSLILPPRHSFEKTLFILNIFNARSECRVRHVVLGLRIQNAKEVGEIFRELKRSGNSLKVLGLKHELGFGKIIRVLARTFLPSLNTIALSHESTSRFFFWNMALWVNVRLLKVDDKDEGIRYCQVDEFGDFQEADKVWLSQSESILLGKTVPTDDLFLVLKAAQSSLEDLDLQDFQPEEPLPVSPDQTSSLGIFQKINMVKLESLRLPLNPKGVETLRELITIEDTSRLFLKGSVLALVHFKLAGMRKLEVHLNSDDSDSVQLLVYHSATDLFLERFSKTEELILCCNSRADFHLNLFLEKLLISPQNPSNHQPIFLPNLVKLVIYDPIELDVKLLEEVIKSRSSVVPSFCFVCKEDTDEETDRVEIEDWAERDWTRKTADSDRR